MRHLCHRWFGLLIGAWSAVLLVLAFATASGGDATVVEHRSAVAARVAVNRATVDLIRAAGQSVAVQISDYHFLRDCRVSLVRGGAEYRRVVRLHLLPGAEAELVELIARELPDDYRATTYRSDGRHRLSASGDEFVELTSTGGSPGQGVLQVEVDTGCRPLDGPVVTLRTPPTRTELARIDEVLDLLGLSRDSAARLRWRTETIGCGDGSLRSVEFSSTSVPDRPLGDLADLTPPDAKVLVREPEVLAYRQGAVSVLATTTEGRLRVTTTSMDC
ncbi:MAG TPA: hypothetical protein VHJ83_12895 [Micromonosporaceae bacterium]|jgi:hypothetical protein|nr:hypothetical protein [Micromonosporaceae bacterium]